MGYGTRNSPVDEISERYRLNHAIVVKLYHPYFSVMFTYFIHESRLVVVISFTVLALYPLSATRALSRLVIEKQ